MRYHELRLNQKLTTVNEAIVNKPHNLGVYVKSRIRDLTQLISAVRTAQKWVKEGDHDGYDQLRYAIRAGSYETPDEDFANQANSLLYPSMIRLDELEGLKDSLESYLKFGADFLKYVLSSMQYIHPLRDDQKRAFRMLQYAEKGFLDYGWVPGHPDTEGDREYQAGKKLVDGYRVLAKSALAFEKLRDDLKVKFGVLQRRASFSYNAEKYRPEHEEVETLYHATAYVTEILRDGFLAEPPEGRHGLGNLGTQKNISFTHDLETARVIMRMLKELWMISNGQLSGYQIMGWAKSEGIEDQVRKSWATITSKPIPVGTRDDPKEVAELYRRWQWFTKVRENPVMMNPDQAVDQMKGRNLADIGVLACEVQLDAKDEYLHAESEFRLPADRVISVKKIL